MTFLPENVVERLQRCSNFPSPPPVALKVIELAQDPNTDLNDVAVACSNDPAIAAKIMKIANSALYTSRAQKHESASGSDCAGAQCYPDSGAEFHAYG